MVVQSARSAYVSSLVTKRVAAQLITPITSIMSSKLDNVLVGDSPDVIRAASGRGTCLLRPPNGWIVFPGN